MSDLDYLDLDYLGFGFRIRMSRIGTDPFVWFIVVLCGCLGSPGRVICGALGWIHFGGARKISCIPNGRKVYAFMVGLFYTFLD
jgi:hypothetical protein